MEKRIALGAELVIPLAALAFTTYFLQTTADMEWEAKANGVFVGWALIALALAQIVRVFVAFARGRAHWGFGELLRPADVFRKRIALLAITIAFVATVQWAGLSLGLFVALAAAMAVMGVRPWRRVLVVALCVAAVAGVGFGVVLDTGLPRGPVENLVSHLVR